MIAWLFTTRVGRWAAAVGAGILAVLAFYGKAKRDGRQAERAKAQVDALRRTQNAIRAGDSVATDDRRLRDNDGFRRD